MIGDLAGAGEDDDDGDTFEKLFEKLQTMKGALIFMFQYK